jgi:hypothetical protein
MVRHPQTVVADLAPATISGAVVAAYEGKRISRLYGTNSAVQRVVQYIEHGHFRCIAKCGQELYLVLVVRVTAATVAATEGIQEFIPAISCAARAFKAGETKTVAAIAGTTVEARYTITLILITCRVQHN